MIDLLHFEYRSQKALKAYANFYADYRLKLLAALAMFVIKASPVWGIPIITANIINLLTNGQKEIGWAIAVQFAIGAVLIVQNIPTHIWYVRILSKTTRSVEMDLRSSLCTRLQQLSIPYHTNSKIGVLQTKVLRDVENIEMLTKMLFDSLPNIFFTVAVAVVVTTMRAPAFLIFYALTVPAAVVLYHLIRNRMSHYNRRFRRSMEDMSGKVVEMLKLIPITRAHNVEAAEITKINAKLERVKTSGLRLDYLNAIFSALNWVVFMMFNLMTLATAAYICHKGYIKMGVGDVVLLTSYFNAIAGGVMQLMNTLPAITKGLESVKSIGEVLECPDIEQNAGKPQITKVDGAFAFDQVGFRYQGSDDHAVDGFSLAVKAGETIALVGPSGSGKSTIMQLIIGFIRPTSGKILIDGQDMNGIDLRSYRRFISVVTQETVLFDGSIRDNIAYGVPQATDAQLQAVIDDANLREFVDRLPDGIDTEIKENGARLSGGQKQRLAIARALLRNPRVLILDEATSALDVESEALIQEALNRLIKGRTTFIVAHRLSTIRNADRIVVLTHGRIAEIGAHDELLARDGIYANMHRLQTGGRLNSDATTTI